VGGTFVFKSLFFAPIGGEAFRRWSIRCWGCAEVGGSEAVAVGVGQPPSAVEVKGI